MPGRRISIALKLSLLAALAALSVVWPRADGRVAQAQGWTLLQSFLDPTPAIEGHFGSSVASVGGNVLVGNPDDDTGATNSGAVYLFDGASGTLLQIFLNPTPATSDSFGSSVAGVGGNVLVGAYGDDTGAPNTGAAYLFDGASGALLHTFLNPFPDAEDGFGISVAAAGDNVLVGAYNDDTGAPNAGAAFLFDSATGSLLQTFLNPTSASFEWFGISVAGVYDNVLVGAQAAGFPANTGAAYLFDSASGSLLQTFPNPAPEGSSFGYSVAAVGGDVLIGAFGNDIGAPQAGAAYLFDGVSGALLQTFLNPTPALVDWFGFKVAAVGSNVLVSATADDSGAPNAGAVYLFDSSSGNLLQTFLSPTPAANDSFGISMAAVGAEVLVGAIYDDTGAPNAGAAYLFQPVSAGDSDGDGCTDKQEVGLEPALGGQRNPNRFWGFFDVPTPPSFTRDRAVVVADISAVVARFGSMRVGGMPDKATALNEALSVPPPPPAYHAGYDRAMAATLTGPPNGSVTIEDVMLAVAQFGHSCL